MRRRIAIMGAAGRDFHNFNVVLPGRPRRRGGRVHGDADPVHRRPDATRRELAGPRYPDGIPIYPEEMLDHADPRARQIDDVVFAYSDVSHEYVMHKASQVLAAGAELRAARARRPRCSRPTVPVVAVCAVRTGCGQEPDHAATSRDVAAGDGKGSAWSRSATRCPTATWSPSACSGSRRFEDLDTARRDDRGARGVRAAPRVTARSCTRASTTARSSSRPQQECDVLLWDGGQQRPAVLPAGRPHHRGRPASGGARAHLLTRARRTSGWPTRS